jgi:hypothetical protein
LIKLQDFKKEKVKTQSLRSYWDIRLRWLESVGKLEKAQNSGRNKKYRIVADES